MIPTSDGSSGQKIFAEMDDDTRQILEAAISSAINIAVELAAQASLIAVPDKQTEIMAKINDTLPSIVNTAMDSAASVLATRSVEAAQGHPQGHYGTAGVIALGAAAASGIGISGVRHELYHAGSVLGDVQALASGNPSKIVRRAGQHVFWRLFGKAGRGIFRAIGG